jgi:hypothetical protein
MNVSQEDDQGELVALEARLRLGEDPRDIAPYFIEKFQCSPIEALLRASILYLPLTILDGTRIVKREL